MDGDGLQGVGVEHPQVQLVEVPAVCGGGGGGRAWSCICMDVHGRRAGVPNAGASWMLGSRAHRQTRAGMAWEG